MVPVRASDIVDSHDGSVVCPDDSGADDPAADLCSEQHGPVVHSDERGSDCDADIACADAARSDVVSVGDPDGCSVYGSADRES